MAGIFGAKLVQNFNPFAATYFNIIHCSSSFIVIITNETTATVPFINKFENISLYVDPEKRKREKKR